MIDASGLWPLVAALGIATTAASASVQPQLSANLSRYPLGLVLPLLALLGLAGMRVFLNERPKYAFFASAAFVSGLILSAAYAIFPHALPARVPGRELGLLAAAAHDDTLESMLLWWVPGMLLAASYSYLLYTRMPKTFGPADADPAQNGAEARAKTVDADQL